MKINKSMLSIMLVASMSITTITPSVVFASTINYSKSISKVKQLGILEGTVSNQNKIVTRGEFVRAIAVSDGLVDPNSDLNGTSIFPDIASDTELCYNINVVVNAGIMAGMPDGLFHPEVGITYAEACTIMVRLLGYSDQDVTGMWPNNYIKKASDLKITTGINLKKSSKLTLKVEALMFDRLLGTLVKKANASEADKYFSDIINAIDYSNPQVVSNYNPKSYEIGDIQFNATTPIMKNGENIKKEDIKNDDVVYSVTDIYGKNKRLVVFSNVIEGTITSFQITGATPTSMQIDNKSYSYSEDMDLSKISSFGVGQLVSVILGYDGKIVALKGIEHKSGVITQCKILGNYKTTDNLLQNQVLTDKGIYTVDSGAPTLELGIKYKLSIDGNTILGIKEAENTTERYPVTEVDGTTITYVQDKAKNTMTLPQANEYYYHGVAVNYSAANSAVQPYSSIILSREKGSAGYTFAVIIDPYFTDPQVYTPTNIELAKQINDIKYDYVYKNGYTIASNVNDRDLVYFVSDVWNQNNFVYLYNSTVVGEVSALLPSKINPTSITIDKVTYTFSSYLSKTSVNNYKNTINIGDTKTLILGIDGKIVNIY